MTIASVSAGANIDPDWGNSVADAINDIYPLIATGTYTPTLTGMVIGTGGSAINTATYTFVGGPDVGDRGVLMVTGRIIFGTSGQTFPTAPTVSLPSGFNFVGHSTNSTPLGLCLYVDATVSQFEGSMTVGSASTFNLQTPQVSGSYLARNNISTTAPFTWAQNDSIHWRIITQAVRV